MMAGVSAPTQAMMAGRLQVLIESDAQAGAIVVDERLRVERVRQRLETIAPTATLSVRLDDAFDAAEARRRYHPDRRLMIVTERDGSGQRKILFDGFAPAVSARWDGHIDREGEWFELEAEHVLSRVARSEASQIFGQHVRNAAIEDGLIGDEAAYRGQSVLASGLTCVFNPDGVGNRAEVPLSVADGGGVFRQIDLFTHPSGMAMPWTYGAVLRYLVWFYLRRSYVVDINLVLEATESVATGLESDGSSLQNRLRRTPTSLMLEATNALEALMLWSAASGIHVLTRTVETNSRPMTQLVIRAAEDAPLRRVFLARGGRDETGEPRYDVSQRSAAQVLADNNVYRGQVRWNHAPLIHRPIVLGGVKRYEVTLPLVPGWLPTANLDNVPEAQRAAAKSLDWTEYDLQTLPVVPEDYEWYRRYHKDGSEFAGFFQVSRLWVLNEDGAFEPGTYNRNAPWDDYQPFEFSSVLGTDILHRETWMRRPRPISGSASLSVDGGVLGPYVEVSFNSGATWYPVRTNVRVLADRAGIYFSHRNPTQIHPPNVYPEDQNMWHALIDQTFRVRVTAIIESDERLIGRFAGDDPGWLSDAVHGRVFRAVHDYEYLSRDVASNVLAATFPPSDAQRNDSEVIDAVARRIAETRAGRTVSGEVTVPWIETRYELGDRIEEVRGRHLRMATTDRTSSLNRYPVVAECEVALRDGVYETWLKLDVVDEVLP